MSRALFTLLFLTTLAAPLDAQGIGYFGSLSRGAKMENIQLGLTASAPFKGTWHKRRWLGPEFEGGYLSAFRSFPNGSAIFSTGLVYHPVAFESRKIWPRLSGGVSVAPVLQKGFRAGPYFGVGLMGNDHGISDRWITLEFRDYVFRVSNRYEHYYGLRLSLTAIE